MPTPRPINVASREASSGTSVTWLINCVPNMPPATPNTATTIGSSIANTDPNATNSTTAAARMPTSSAVPVGGSWTRVTAWPPSSTWSPSPAAARAVSTTSCTSAFGTASACSANVTCA
jgi:hypothetical protein